MGRPLYEHGKRLVDIGVPGRPVILILEVLENFGGFGRHSYEVVDLSNHHYVVSEVSLEEINEGNCNQPRGSDRRAGLG